MSKQRLEAFSDGVLAILITIMVLELHIPEGPTLSALFHVLPSLVCYILSFIYLAIYWNNHHHLLQATRHVNGTILWANMHLLFWLSLVPFFTNWLAHHYRESVPTAIYGAILLLSAIAYVLLQRTIIREHGHDSVLAKAVSRDRKGMVSLAIYASSIGFAFVLPTIADIGFVAVAIIWLLPDRRIERTLTERHDVSA